MYRTFEYSNIRFELLISVLSRRRIDHCNLILYNLPDSNNYRPLTRAYNTYTLWFRLRPLVDVPRHRQVLLISSLTCELCVCELFPKIRRAISWQYDYTCFWHVLRGLHPRSWYPYQRDRKMFTKQRLLIKRCASVTV